MRPEFKSSFANCWLRVATSTVSYFARFFLCKRIIFVFGDVGLTDILFLTETPDELEALFAIANGESVSQLFGLVQNALVLAGLSGRRTESTYIQCFDLSTIVADRLQDLLDLSQKACLGVSEVEQEFWCG